MSNTINSSLYPSIAIDALNATLHNKLAPLNSFTTAFSLEPLAPLRPVVIMANTAGPTVQTNATDFTAGNSTLAPITITPARITATVNLTDAEMNRGFQLHNLAEQQANNLADGISDVVTALLTAGNFGTQAIGAAANFDKSDLAPILSTAKNYPRKNLILDGGHMAYLLPEDRNSFRLVEEGAYGFDSLVMNNRWTAAETNCCGFVCSPQAIVVASGTSTTLAHDKYYELVQTVTLKNGLPVRLAIWHVPSTQITYAMMDVVFGAAVGDATAGKVLVTA